MFTMAPLLLFLCVWLLIQHGESFTMLSGRVRTPSPSSSRNAPSMSSLGDIEYEYLDSGNQRRLERFGDVLVVRPCPSATWEAGLPRSTWREAKVVYENGEWRGTRHLPMDPDDADQLAWKVAIHPNLVLSLTTSDQGQVGMFPEQINNWNWIRFMCTRAKLAMNMNAGRNDNGQAHGSSNGLNLDDNLSVLNAFAYTGGSTLAALGIQGVNVTHLDASKSFVSWAQRNVEASGLRDRPGARFIVDDCMSFMQREVRRGRRYQGMILDPPAFGRGPKGKGKGGEWKLDKDLPELAALLPSLLSRRPAFLVLTCHDPKWPARKLQTLLQHTPGMPKRGVYETQDMVLRSTQGGKDLPMGQCVRVSWLMK